MNKFLFLTLSFILVISIPITLSADNDSHTRSVEEILSVIKASQNVTQTRDIDPDKVSDDMLEELGDAVMSLTHPDEKVHEWMDSMMGGEGSESLRSAHIMMGYNYLAGTNVNKGRYPYSGGMMGNGWGMPMMGNYNGHGRWGMNSFFSGGGALMILGLIILAGGVITGIIVLNKRNDNVTGIGILKKRLAKGEITKEEFDTLKHDVI